MQQPLPDAVVIASWPDGMRLVRPVGEQIGGLLDRTLRGAMYAHLGNALLAIQSGDIVPWILLNRANAPVLYLELHLAFFTGQPIIAGDFAVEPYLAIPSRVMLSEAEHGATVWTLTKLIEQPIELVDNIAILPFPEVHGPSSENLHPIMSSSTSRALKAQAELPTDQQMSAWISLTHELISQMELRWGPEFTTDDVRWSFTIGGWDFLMALAVSGPPSDVVPVWTVHDGYWHDEQRTRATPLSRTRTGPLPTERSVPLGRLASSSKSPYAALRDAGILVLESEYLDWLAAHSRPGTINPDFSSYRLLGLSIPPLLPEEDWAPWVRAQKSAS